MVQLQYPQHPRHLPRLLLLQLARVDMAHMGQGRQTMPALLHIPKKRMQKEKAGTMPRIAMTRNSQARTLMVLAWQIL